MALRLPVKFPVEYRGVQSASSFVARESGELIEVPPKLKFEYEAEDGDVVLIPVSANQLDKAVPAIDHATLQKGSHYVLSGFVLLADRGSQNNSYLSVRSLVSVTDVVRLVDEPASLPVVKKSAASSAAG
jgi:hypothetical protein